MNRAAGSIMMSLTIIIVMIFSACGSASLSSGEDEDRDSSGGYEFELKNGETVYYNEEKLGDYGLPNSSGTFPVIATDNRTGKMGIIGPDGSFVVECDYDQIDMISDDRYSVMMNGKSGVIDAAGEEIVHCEYSVIMSDPAGCTDSADRYLCAKKGRRDLYGYLSLEDGSTLIEPGFSEALGFNGDDLAAVCTVEGKWGYIDRKGKMIIGAVYRGAGPFEGRSVAPVKCDNDKWAFIDKCGNQVTAAKYAMYDVDPYVCDYEDGRILDVMTLDKDGSLKHGLIDETGKEIVPCIYSQIDSYHDGLLVVIRDFSTDDGDSSELVDVRDNVIVPEEKYRRKDIQVRIDALDEGFYGVSYFSVADEDYEDLYDRELSREYFDSTGQKLSEQEMESRLKAMEEKSAQVDPDPVDEEDPVSPEVSWTVEKDESSGLCALYDADSGKKLTEPIFNTEHSCD